MVLFSLSTIQAEKSLFFLNFEVGHCFEKQLPLIHQCTVGHFCWNRLQSERSRLESWTAGWAKYCHPRRQFPVLPAPKFHHQLGCPKSKKKWKKQSTKIHIQFKLLASDFQQQQLNCCSSIGTLTIMMDDDDDDETTTTTATTTMMMTTTTTTTVMMMMIMTMMIMKVSYRWM